MSQADFDALVGRLKQAGPAGVQAMAIIAADSERITALAKPVADLLPGIDLRYIPAVLMILRRSAEAIELAGLLAKGKLIASGAPITADGLKEYLHREYFPEDLMRDLIRVTR
jgi:hypothetical protein